MFAAGLSGLSYDTEALVENYPGGLIKTEFVNLGAAPYQHVSRRVVTQGMLGEPLELIEGREGWLYVKMSDGYPGWIDANQVEPLPAALFTTYKQRHFIMSTAHFAPIHHPFTGKRMGRLLLSGRLPVVGHADRDYLVALPDGRTGSIAKASCIFMRSFEDLPVGTVRDIINLARTFEGLPYLWGGTTAYGFDCSGFIQILYRRFGCPLFRDADQQYEQGTVIESRENLQEGDLVFFTTYKKGPSHVGIYMGEGAYIHASSSQGVTVNSFDPEASNYNQDLDEKYLGARRVLT